ncbi:unnamed protein product [Lactuca virosa]|uniref:Growth-regulating factor n=1 Tax=Lactuca virosa TaxID=75947 RepID=A0AAU9LC42_9ASTR|nr:unnamed protein product [Lactuca virosa]
MRQETAEEGEEIRSILKVIASTAKFCHDWEKLRSMLSLHLKHVWGVGVVRNCFHMGFGRKVDPEPGRCRRTNGKKWRCYKEAYLNSKYCERHIHRGRNRSRKHVEVNSTPNTTPL